MQINDYYIGSINSVSSSPSSSSSSSSSTAVSRKDAIRSLSLTDAYTINCDHYPYGARCPSSSSRLNYGLNAQFNEQFNSFQDDNNNNYNEMMKENNPFSSSLQETIENHDDGNNNNKILCMSKEFWTCLALSSIVIGLPVAIMMMLINLPKLSNQRDTRQQNYILLAFGLPFSCVIIVATIYALYKLVRKIRRHDSSHPHPHHHKIKPYQNSLTISQESEEKEEPKLYSLVTQIMSNRKYQQQEQEQHTSARKQNSTFQLQY